MSDTMTEGVIVSWQKKEGDTVKSGDVLAEVETDKATMDLEAYEEGTLLYIGVKEGESVAVDAVIAVVGEKGANFKVLLDGGPSAGCPRSCSRPLLEKAAAKRLSKTHRPACPPMPIRIFRMVAVKEISLNRTDV